MILGKSIDYNSFKVKASKENLDMIVHKESQQISYFNNSKDKILDKILSINIETNIAVFSSSRCPDAATATPILVEISKINPNIHINFYDIEEHKDFLNKCLSESKIPTFINMDTNSNVISKYCEFPVAFKKILSDVQFREDADSIITDFRNGEFNDILLDELIELILGTEQNNYISFDKTKLPYKSESSSPQD